MAKQKFIKMWVTPKTKENAILKQSRIMKDLNIKVPIARIMEASLNQPLIPDNAGLDLRRFRKLRRI